MTGARVLGATVLGGDELMPPSIVGWEYMISLVIFVPLGIALFALLMEKLEAIVFGD
ncbi:hypothetical protein [Corynebacterium macginleyi]|uniref:hypothetical protein n=1 Tax=Corynebacterium macginleyi TaxID=38290 RepID=UPI00142E13CF|nr:hypothetical protein [Corynebacterium macginleyi]QRP21522.1 hypothetical protein I6J25_01270 [Corynebacterium macginleyi]